MGKETEPEPAIHDEVVMWAMNQLPNKKAPGVDNISVELPRPVQATVIRVFCQKIWETNPWPRNWK